MYEHLKGYMCNRNEITTEWFDTDALNVDVVANFSPFRLVDVVLVRDQSKSARVLGPYTGIGWAFSKGDEECANSA